MNLAPILCWNGLNVLDEVVQRATLISFVVLKLRQYRHAKDWQRQGIKHY